MSGIEIDSPHKQISVAQNFPVVINGVGELTSMWIGQRGVLEITKKKDQEEKKIAIAEKSHEIQMLAVTCLDAFEAVGLRSSEVPEVRKAIELCSSYMPLPACKKTPETSSSVATLWKEQACSSNIEQDIDSRAVAVSVLWREVGISCNTRTATTT